VLWGVPVRQFSASIALPGLAHDARNNPGKTNPATSNVQSNKRVGKT